MPRITISYRRDDSGVITGRIFDRLATHYGRESVFRDIDSIPPGADFRQHINQVLGESDILLAIVGPRWLGSRGAQTRLDDEADPVRIEIEACLRKQVPVIPVLVLRAAMPRVVQLPDTVKDFAYRHAVQVDAGQDFDVHAARLIRAVDRILRQKYGGAPARDGDAADEAVLLIDAEPTRMLEPLPPPIPRVAGGAVPAIGYEAAPAFARAPREAAIVPPADRRRRATAIAVAAGVILGAIAASAAIVALRPSLPLDVAALAAAKEAAEARALALQAELSGTQKKAAATQDGLDAAQKQVADLDKHLADLQAGADQAAKDLATQKDLAAKAQAQIQQLIAQLQAAGDKQARTDTDLAAQRDAVAKAQAQLAAAQARADKAEKDEKQLAAQISAGQDKGAASQKLVEQQAAQLNAATARADAAESDLAAQRDAVAKAQAEIERLSQQVKSLNDQLAALKTASTTPQPAAVAPAETAADDSAWTPDQRREAQADLVVIGHLQGTADGNFGPATRAAIKQFQSFAGDLETGVMTDAERDRLHDMAQRLTALVVRGETSPNGVAASAVKGAAQRYQRAWAAEKGSNGAADPGEAVYWYGLAAGDGDPRAFTNLGILLVRGRGVAKPEPEAAALLWWAAAAHGEGTAMFNLGALWEHGIGVAADLATAKTWYQRAAAKNDPQALAALKRLGA